MATLVRAPEEAPTRSALALWHLLSLDAASIAALWTWFVAACVHIALPLTSCISMFAAVWLLYAADRLLDARSLTSRPGPALDLEARHLFHARHRPGFLAGIVVALLVLARTLPATPPRALHLFLLLGAALAIYFALIHATPAAPRLPKEFAVGLFFSAAVFIPTLARAPWLRLRLLAPAVLFGALCTLNCLCIYGWEHGAHASRTCSHQPRASQAARPHGATRLALRHLGVLQLALFAAALALLCWEPQPLPIAVALSTAALVVLGRVGHRLGRVHLRAAADLALATPLLLLPFLGAHL